METVAALGSSLRLPPPLPPLLQSRSLTPCPPPLPLAWPSAAAPPLWLLTTTTTRSTTTSITPFPRARMLTGLAQAKALRSATRTTTTAAQQGPPRPRAGLGLRNRLIIKAPQAWSGPQPATSAAPFPPFSRSMFSTKAATLRWYETAGRLPSVPPHQPTQPAHHSLSFSQRSPPSDLGREYKGKQMKPKVFPDFAVRVQAVLSVGVFAWGNLWRGLGSLHFFKFYYYYFSLFSTLIELGLFVCFGHFLKHPQLDTSHSSSVSSALASQLLSSTVVK